MGILRGKLIKKADEKTIGKLDIQLYPWLQFKEKNIVFPDNPRRSVILTKYHDPKEIKEKILNAPQFDELLEKKTTPLYPVDLTKDYEEGIRELIKRKRRRLMGEEEAMALELAEIDMAHQVRFQPNSKGIYKNSDGTDATSEDEIKLNFDEVPLPPPINIENSFSEAFMDGVTPKPPEYNPASMPDDPIPEHLSVPADFHFVPEESQKKRENHENKFKAEEPIPHDAGNEKEGFEKGYRDGFKDGEEKAVRTQESKYEAVFENIAKVVHEIEKLKDSLYSQSKDVFVEIIKLATEKILREQIKFSDNAITGLFDEVIQTISKKSSIKIELNSQDLIRMKKHIEKIGINDRVTLKEDNSKLSGDFNIESERGISVVDLKKSVDTLVEKLKLELFSEEEDSKKVS